MAAGMEAVTADGMEVDTMVGTMAALATIDMAMADTAIMADMATMDAAITGVAITVVIIEMATGVMGCLSTQSQGITALTITVATLIIMGMALAADGSLAITIAGVTGFALIAFAGKLINCKKRVLCYNIEKRFSLRRSLLYPSHDKIKPNQSL